MVSQSISTSHTWGKLSFGMWDIFTLPETNVFWILHEILVIGSL